MPANKIKLEICGARYVIAPTDTAEYVLSLAEKLDADMNQMRPNNPSASIATAAVITALGYLDELKKSTSGADNMRAQIKDYLEDAAKAKLSAEVWKQTADKENGKLVLVTAINPTPAGEGKTTVSVGLADGMTKIGKKAMLALREPSLGPVFGMKGGAAGGGRAQVLPMEQLNMDGYDMLQFVFQDKSIPIRVRRMSTAKN